MAGRRAGSEDRRAGELAVALRRRDPAPSLGSTIKLSLQEWERVSRPVGVRAGGLALSLAGCGTG